MSSLEIHSNPQVGETDEGILFHVPYLKATTMVTT